MKHFLTIIILLITIAGCNIYEKKERNVYNYNTSGEAYDLCISNDKLFIANGSKGILVLDINEPTNPSKITELDLTNDVKCIYATDSLVFAGTDSGDFYVFILRNDSLVEKNYWNLRDPLNQCYSIVGIRYYRYGNFIYVLTNKTIAVFKLYPFQFLKQKLLYYSEAIDIDADENNWMFKITQRKDGVRNVAVYESGDSINIHLSDWVFSPGYLNMEGIFPNGSCIEGNGWFFAEGEDGIRGYGIGTNVNNDTLYFFDTRGYAYDGCGSFEYIYVADGEGVSVLKMSLDERMKEVYYYELEGLTKKIIPYNNYPKEKFFIFTASGNKGIYIFKQED